MTNVDRSVVKGFGDEWRKFDQRELDHRDRLSMFEDYFHIFPWDRLPAESEGMDIGCGSGRWAVLVAPRVGILHCVDPSSALEVARAALSGVENVRLHYAEIDNLPVPDGSLDFAYSLGVLHHVPDTEKAILSCVRKLKKGAPFLVYLYYKFDNRPMWYRALWHASEMARFLVSRAPFPVRYVISQLFALVVYWPLARFALIAEKLGVDVRNFPLTYYRDKTFYVLRTDSLDRFGTKLEKRFTKSEIKLMLKHAGLVDIRFSDRAPFWTAVGVKA